MRLPTAKRLLTTCVLLAYYVLAVLPLLYSHMYPFNCTLYTLWVQNDESSARVRNHIQTSTMLADLCKQNNGWHAKRISSVIIWYVSLGPLAHSCHYLFSMRRQIYLTVMLTISLQRKDKFMHFQTISSGNTYVS